MAVKKPPVKERMRLVDPVYKKFTARAFKTMTSAEFYDYFMAAMSNGQHEFQFSNRKVEKNVDERWVEEIEAALPAMEEITKNPRIIITQEELITSVALAKKVTPQVVRHLCAHGDLVERITDDGDVIPSRILNIFKEESWDTYENRFVYTLIEKTYQFVDIRYQKLFAQMEEEFGARLLINSTAATSLEEVKVNMNLHIKQIDDLLATDGKQETIFSRIARIHRLLNSLLGTQFSNEVKKFSRVKSPIVPTNAIKKNPYLRKCNKLWDFITSYMDIGYSIRIIEQNPEINTKFEQDIFNDIMFNYIILKGYLEDNRDRAIDYKVKSKKKTLKPKYIKEIVEEMVQNYDLPDVEIRKVLIEELTKAQLMEEEEAERRRLVEEKEREMKEKKRLEDLEKARIQKEKEKEERRIAREKERERVRKQKEAEAEKLRLQKEKERKLASEARFGQLLKEELEKQKTNIEAVLVSREKQRKLEEERLIREEKARLAAEEKARKEEARRIAKEKQLEEERIAKEKQLAEEKAERERIRLEEAKKKAEEKVRLAEEKAKLQAEKKAQREAATEARKIEKVRFSAEEKARKMAEQAAKLEAERIALEEQARMGKERIEEEEKARLEAEEKLQLEKLRKEEAIAKAKAEEEEKIKAEEQAKLDALNQRIEARFAEEYPKSGLGRGKNARLKKKLEKQFREHIRKEEMLATGMLSEKEKQDFQKELEAERIEQEKLQEVLAEIEEIEEVKRQDETVEVEVEKVEEVAEEVEKTAPTVDIRKAIQNRWKSWRK